MHSIRFLALILLIQWEVFSQKPKSVILYIGDGFGIAPKTAARMAMGQGLPGKQTYNDAGFHVLAMDKLRYTAMATTHSANSWTTDSAPGAAVYSTGQKIDNEVIAYDLVLDRPLETILEKAKKQGYAVGLVTTTRITHATPASFGSHIWHRDLESHIAAQLISSSNGEYIECFGRDYNPQQDGELPTPKVGVQIDVLLGGGLEYFVPEQVTDSIAFDKGYTKFKGKRKDGSSLLPLAARRGFRIVRTRSQLMQLDSSDFVHPEARLLGLFAPSHIAYEQDRQLFHTDQPSLADMVEVAIKILVQKAGRKGFFLMVEGGRIDHLGHANAGGVSRSCEPSLDSVAYSPDNKEIILHNTPQGSIRGSDYLIKEVLSFDHSIAIGQKHLQNPKFESLLLSTSDHECGAIAVVGLYDHARKGLRTYADEPVNASATSAVSNKILRGDGSTGGYFPQYTTYTFQNRVYPRPASDTARRIIITYASNPHITMHCGGNHTPQDIWVGADDNIQGKAASRITGKGMLDNTYLHPIMMQFLGLK